MTDLNLTNLRILRDYLESNFHAVQHSLDMEVYVGEVDEGELLFEDVLESVRSAQAGGEHWCGSTGCMIGHGLMSGIPELTPERWPNMAVYQRETYGDTLGMGGNNAINFMFAWNWPSDLDQGIRRINYVIEHGGNIPADWRWGMWDYWMGELGE